MNEYSQYTVKVNAFVYRNGSSVVHFIKKSRHTYVYFLKGILNGNRIIVC